MTHVFTLGDTEYALWLARRDGLYSLALDGIETAIALTPNADGTAMLTLGAVSTPVLAAVDGDILYIHLDGATHTLRYLDPIRRHASHSGASAEDIIQAPMPGTVIALHVAAGATVLRGETMIVIESMKLETAIKAPRDAVVDAVHVAQGRTFDRGNPLITLAPAAGD